MRNKLTRKDICHYLCKLSIAVLSTVDSDNKPHSAAMFFTVDEDLNFFLMTKSTTKKYLNCEKNKNVALTVIDPHVIKTVQVHGAIERVTDTEVTTKVIVALEEKNAVGGISYWPPPLSKIQEGEIVILKVTPTWLRYADYSNPAAKEQDVFHQIIP